MIPIRLPALLLAGSLFCTCTRATHPAGQVSGDFCLEQAEFCVGEPILIKFSVRNGADHEYSFDVGGDYRGTLRHDRFSFSVTDSAGRDFTSKSRGNLGGLGTRIVLKPKETYVCYQLLTAWVHLLPPGSYRVQSERKLTLGPKRTFTKSDTRPLPVTIAKELSFLVVEYDQARIVGAIRRMKDTRKISGANIKRSWVGKPVGWALADLSDKFQMGAPWSGKEDEHEKAVLSGLPAQWDDGYSLEYALSSNRNWLTAKKPEEFSLTLSVRNNSNKTIPHRLDSSSLSINGVNMDQWPQALKAMLQERGVGDTLKPAETLKLGRKSNDFLTDEAEQEIVWQVGPFRKAMRLRLRR